MSDLIADVRGRRVWDSRGRPTVEVELVSAFGKTGRAIAPAGASTGSGEALDRRDGGPALGGMDVRRTVADVRTIVRDLLVGRDPTDQAGLDAALIAEDGTPDKSRLGGNAMIAASMAAAHLAAAVEGVPLWRHLAERDSRTPAPLPLPEIQICGGGLHAGRRIDIQDIMVIAVGAPDYPTALDWTAEVYLAAGKLLAEAGRLQGVADEGGYWPAFDRNEDALDLVLRAIEAAGFRPGEDLALSLDIAASALGTGGRYQLASEARTLISDELGDLLLGWLGSYPIVAIEDPLGEDDAEGLARFAAAAPAGVEVVLDDAVVTSAARIREMAAVRAGTTALIKPNQAGTLTETKAALEAARAVGWNAIVSARSGETEDVTIVHLAVGWGIPQLKVGSFARSERMAKWNEGLRIAEAIPTGDALPPRAHFPWGAA